MEEDVHRGVWRLGGGVIPVIPREQSVSGSCELRSNYQP